MNIVIEDCNTFIKSLDSNSIDLIYFNPPFGTTEQEWDKKIDWETLFPEMNRVIKPNGNIIIHCAIPFTYDLIRHKKPKYHWIWNKCRTGSPFLAKKQPMRNTEEILVYHKDNSTGKYYPIMIGDELNVIRGSKSAYYGSRHNSEYKSVVRGKYPKHLIEFPRYVDGFSTRPEELIEYIIKTYTVENDLILDLTCYKGLSGKVADSLNRKWIGCDIKDWVNDNFSQPERPGFSGS